MTTSSWSRILPLMIRSRGSRGSSISRAEKSTIRVCLWHRRPISFPRQAVFDREWDSLTCMTTATMFCRRTARLQKTSENGLKGRRAEWGAGSMLINGSVKDPFSKVLGSAASSLKVRKTAAARTGFSVGELKYGPRIGGKNNAAFITHVNETHLVLYYNSKQVVSTGALSPSGKLSQVFPHRWWGATGCSIIRWSPTKDWNSSYITGGLKDNTFEGRHGRWGRPPELLFWINDRAG